ncbi:MAG: hypothetical protein KJ629_01750 [Candidatus Omnitrophica bacterium]|nr:hypothetical protein [Candidatus Omnitrophota bacterium]MBU1524110.1 hypothetical protein [Candidatus Omnitrophota bacterium]MBU1809854.1 hypothetical protein [Candidatus Omnitrophota bacterium]MBU2436738.1 hypothetical protein [Candidatus Omnitrophota bacterium]MBU2505057.1 hypothetical protein [Candidatus Omnitrophota bacterium]
MKKVSKVSLDNDSWIREHLEELVERYPGQYVVVADNEAFVGYDARKLEIKARKKHPCTITTGMPIPQAEDFNSIL